MLRYAKRPDFINRSRPRSVCHTILYVLTSQSKMQLMKKWVTTGLIMILSCSLSLQRDINPRPPPKAPITQECFTAAVYEHVKKVGTEDDPAAQVLAWNLAIYERVTAEAKRQGADIIVFPEYGVFGITHDNRTLIRPYLENIPSGDQRKNPCDDPSPYLENSFLVTLSCMAKNHSIYLAANVGDMKPCSKQTDPKCPDDGAYQYNTNVVFDRNGTLISRYYKKHLFHENKFNQPEEFQNAYFDTEFGRLASFVCFDIAFKPAVTLVEDYDVDTILFLTWWFNSLPGWIAPQVQESFAIVNKVNLLGSNIHDPNLGNVGSGIYTGVNGAINHVHIPDGVPRLLISRIPSQSAKGKVCEGQELNKVIEFPADDVLEHVTPKPTSSRVYAIDVSKYTFVKLSRPKDKLEMCQNGLCCTLEYEVDSDFSDTYYFGITNGINNDRQTYFWCMEMCFLTTGYEPNVSPSRLKYVVDVSTTFKKVDIRGRFSTRYVYPTAFSGNHTLITKKDFTYSFDEDSGKASITLSNLVSQPIYSVNLVGRCYDRDPPYPQ